MMDVQEIKSKIIKDLEFNITPTYRNYSINREEFLIILTELKNEGKIRFDLIDNHPVFEGEPKNIRLTSRGR